LASLANLVLRSVMQVNILEAKNQLSRLVKEAVGGADVVIANNGTPLVRLVPVARRSGLRGFGSLKVSATKVDAAFTPAVDEEVARRLRGRR
jgi:prevent-host-death family protein